EARHCSGCPGRCAACPGCAGQEKVETVDPKAAVERLVRCVHREMRHCVKDCCRSMKSYLVRAFPAQGSVEPCEEDIREKDSRQQPSPEGEQEPPAPQIQPEGEQGSNIINWPGSCWGAPACVPMPIPLGSVPCQGMP